MSYAVLCISLYLAYPAQTRAAYDPAVQDLLSKKYENTSQVAQAVVPNKAGEVHPFS